MIPYAYKGQDLFSHLEGVATRARRYLDFEVASRRFDLMGLSVAPEDLERVLENAALLHDVGKAADRYQRRLVAQEGDSKVTFSLHELPSAVISQRVCKALGLQEWEEILVCLLVLQHMSAIRDWMASKREINFEGWTFKDCEAELGEFIKRRFGLSVRLEVRKAEVLALLDLFWRLARSPKYRWLKLHSLLLAPLTAADSIDAYNARKENLTSQRRWFVEELMNLEEP